MFDGIKRAARAFFVEDLRVRRDERGLRIVFESGPAGESQSPLERAHQEAEQRRLKQVHDIRAQLARLFETHPGLGVAGSPMHAIDRALAAQGLAFLDSVPLAVLRPALEAFEAAVIDWSPAGLAYLRSRMAVALRERAAREAADVGDTSALPVVSEVSMGVAGRDDEQAALLAAYGAVARPPGETP